MAKQPKLKANEFSPRALRIKKAAEDALKEKMNGRAPVIKFRDSDPLQDYYILTSSDKTEYFSVSRLIDAAKDLKPDKVVEHRTALQYSAGWHGFRFRDLARLQHFRSRLSC